MEHISAEVQTASIGTDRPGSSLPYTEHRGTRDLQASKCHPTRLQASSSDSNAEFKASSSNSKASTTMTSHDPFLEAGQTLSQALSGLGVNHAFIGGFAVNLLGSQRSTDDIDVEVDTTDGVKLISRLIDPALGGDSRFTIHNNKLVFIPLDHDISQRIPIELLRIGDLGLPKTLSVIYPDGMWASSPPPLSTLLVPTHIHITGTTLPVLNPPLLVLTKTKRCVMYIGSTRPASVRKFQSDLLDIGFLLDWLQRHGQSIDFAGYHCADGAAKDRLYMAVAKLLGYYKEKGLDGQVRLLESVLDDGDKERVIGMDTTEP